MKTTIKSFLKKVPFVLSLYLKLRARRAAVAARKVFENHEVYFKASEEKGDGTVELRTHDGLRFTVRQNLWDARILKEIFVDEPYARFFELPSNPVVVDVGGYIGDFSVYAAKRLGARRVVVYEPTAENFQVLEQNIANNGFEDRIIAVNKAVSDGSDVRLNVDVLACGEVHVSEFFYEGAENRTVPSVSLAELMDGHQLDAVDLLKVDCEGGEYSIFPGASDEVLGRVANIVFEYHKIDGYEAKLDDVFSRLRSAGFALRVEGPIVYASRDGAFSPGQAS